MLKTERIRGVSSAMAGSMMGALHNQSITKRYTLRFDPRVPWRKIQFWVQVRRLLGSLLQQVINKNIHDPSSPFYTQLHESRYRFGIDRNHYVFFDASEYKANRQTRTPQEVKRILNLPPERRSQQEIYSAMIGLSGINSIAEYPIRMQRYVAEFGTFQSYTSKRVIVKQGRPPDAVYYILYGSVVMTACDEKTGKIDVQGHLQRGQSFGERAIVEESCRLSSVVTKGYTELLSLSSQVFHKYFMAGGVKTMNDPDGASFVRSLSLLKGWPIELILQNMDQQRVTFCHFKRGAVVTLDSNDSRWLIVVKSGSLKVMKKLLKVHPNVSRKSGLPKTKSVSSHSRYLCFLRDSREYQRCLKQNKITLPLPFDAEDDNEEPENSHDTEETRARPRTSQTIFMGQRSSLPNLKGTLSAEVKVRSSSKGPELSAHFRKDMSQATQFVLVQTLTKGDIFGLAQCLFNEQPSLSVVSGGADCLLIDKRFYLDNCSTELMRRLRVQVSPYPTHEALQESLCTRINWEAYKSVLMKALQKHKTSL